MGAKLRKLIDIRIPIYIIRSVLKVYRTTQTDHGSHNRIETHTLVLTLKQLQSSSTLTLVKSPHWIWYKGNITETLR